MSPQHPLIVAISTISTVYLILQLGLLWYVLAILDKRWNHVKKMPALLPANSTEYIEWLKEEERLVRRSRLVDYLPLIVLVPSILSITRLVLLNKLTGWSPVISAFLIGFNIGFFVINRMNKELIKLKDIRIDLKEKQINQMQSLNAQLFNDYQKLEDNYRRFVKDEPISHL